MVSPETALDILPVTSVVSENAYVVVYLTRLVFAPLNWSVIHTSISTPTGPAYSIIILSPAAMVYGVVSVNVYSANEVPKVVEFIVSLKVATIASSDLLLTFAVTLPDGVPRFRNLTFQVFSDFPIRRDVAVLASSPYLTLPPEFNVAYPFPGIVTL